MRILFMAQHYAPEEVSGAVLATELAVDLVRRGHDVTFVTCAPNYPQGRVFAGYGNRLYQVEIREGVRVVRTWSYISSHRGFWPRILNFGTFSISAFYGALLAGRSDVVFSYSPPLPLGVSAWFLSRLWHIPWVLRVEDLYPDAAVATGVLRNPAAIALLAALEGFLYPRATHISLISEGFKQNLLSKGVAGNKLSVIPVWADPELVQPQAKGNSFRREHSLEGKFVVMYAGTLGLTSALEDVLQAARYLKDDSDTYFVMIGEGVKKEALVRFARDNGLENVIFLPFQPRSAFSEMMAAADVSLVTLNRASSPFSLPSKVFNIMASARPILAVAPPESEVARLVQAACCGVSVSPDQPDALAKAILGLRHDPGYLERLGRNGRAQLELCFSRRRCVDLYEATLEQVMA